MFDQMQARLTPAEWTELAEAQRDGSSPAWLKSLAPILVGCARLGHSSNASASVPGSDSAQSPPPDDADSARVARELRRVRVAEEAQKRQMSGHLVMLPTGRCTANITLDSTGRPQGYFPVSCSDPELQADMRQAVLAALPLSAIGPATLQLRVTANDAQPVDDGVASPMRAADPPSDIDRRYTMLVRQELQAMRQQQVMQNMRAHVPPPEPLFGTCSATVQLSDTATGSLPASSSLSCSDPRLEDSMHRAIMAAALLGGPNTATVHLRLNGIFPSP